MKLGSGLDFYQALIRCHCRASALPSINLSFAIGFGFTYEFAWVGCLLNIVQARTLPKRKPSTIWGQAPGSIPEQGAESSTFNFVTWRASIFSLQVQISTSYSPSQWETVSSKRQSSNSSWSKRLFFAQAPTWGTYHSQNQYEPHRSWNVLIMLIPFESGADLNENVHPLVVRT